MKRIIIIVFMLFCFILTTNALAQEYSSKSIKNHKSIYMLKDAVMGLGVNVELVNHLKQSNLSIIVKKNERWWSDYLLEYSYVNNERELNIILNFIISGKNIVLKSMYHIDKEEPNPTPRVFLIFSRGSLFAVVHMSDNLDYNDIKWANKEKIAEKSFSSHILYLSKVSLIQKKTFEKKVHEWIEGED